MNKERTTNKMGTEAVPKVMLNMGIPIILSMVLQACYNIVDSMFVARIPDTDGIVNAGECAVNALTLAFSVQMLMIIAMGFLFAGGNIAIQGVFQALGCGLDSLVVSLLRLCIVVLPLAWMFSRMENAAVMIWWAFPIAEFAAILAAVGLMLRANKNIIKPVDAHKERKMWKN